MAAVSKAEYLKRYLSGPGDEEKKKKRKKKQQATSKRHPKSVIVDDDVSWNELAPKDGAVKQQEDFDAAGEEGPAVYDDDGTTMISAEVYKKREEDKKTKWAPLRGRDEEEKQGGGESPIRRVRHDSSDTSPARITSRSDTPDASPRRRQHGSPDLSPARIANQSTKDGKRSRSDVTRLRDTKGSSTLRDSPDHSPPGRRTRHDSDSSPPRRTRHDSDSSPPRRTRHDSDASPSRNIHSRSTRSPVARQRHDSPEQSRVQRRQRHDSSDLSPPRGRAASDSDQSPPRKRQDADSDLSPPRGRKGSDSDQSPPRRRPASPQKGKSGLLSADDLKKENTLKRKKEAAMFATMDTDVSGRGAQTVHRDKQGRKRDLEAEKRKKMEEEKKKAKEDEQFIAWGKGVTQSKQAQHRLEEERHEMSKPLARYKDDADLDSMLRDKNRSDDPMLVYMQKKKSTSDTKAGKKAKPVYKGPHPQPNRFGIQPGYRWDGADRSNGFEKKRFAMLANKRATESMAHKWSVEDM